MPVGVGTIRSVDTEHVPRAGGGTGGPPNRFPGSGGPTVLALSRCAQRPPAGSATSGRLPRIGPAPSERPLGRSVSGFPAFSSVEPLVPLVRSGFPVAGVSGRSGLAGVVPAGLPVGFADARVPPDGSAGGFGAADGVGVGRAGVGSSGVTVAQKPATESLASLPAAPTPAAVRSLVKAGFSATCGLLAAPAAQARHSPIRPLPPLASAGSIGGSATASVSVSSAGRASDSGDAAGTAVCVVASGRSMGSGVEVAATATPPAPAVNASAAMALATTIRDSVRACMGLLRHSSSGSGRGNTAVVNAEKRHLHLAVRSPCRGPRRRRGNAQAGPDPHRRRAVFRWRPAAIGYDVAFRIPIRPAPWRLELLLNAPSPFLRHITDSRASRVSAPGNREINRIAAPVECVSSTVSPAGCVTADHDRGVMHQPRHSHRYPSRGVGHPGPGGGAPDGRHPASDSTVASVTKARFRVSRGRSRGVATTPSTTAGRASDPAGPPTGSRKHGCRDVHQARPRVRTAAPDGATAADDRHHQQPCPDEHPDDADPAVHDGGVPGRGCAQTVAGNRIVQEAVDQRFQRARQRRPSRTGQVARDSDPTGSGQPAVGTWPVTR